MGQILIYKCNKCGNEVKINDGFGMLWHSFDKSMFYPAEKNTGLNFYNNFDENTIKNIQEFLEVSENIIVEEVYYQPYICNKCGKIESKLYFKMYNSKTGEIYKLKYSCDCGGKYRKLTDKDREHICCYKCGDEMVATEEILWD